MDEQHDSNSVLSGPVLRTFLGYAIPSILGLVAITTASIVDGIFVGHFVGPDALAAINLMIPYFTFLFGLAIMLSIGGAVRAGRLLGEGRPAEASATFSRCVLAIVFIALAFLLLALLFDRWILTLLGAPAELHELMLPYFRLISVVLVLQLGSMVTYYFVRLDAKPSLATSALLAGALANIALDALFIGYFGWGLAGAACATGLAQVLQILVLGRYFLNPKRRLNFTCRPGGWLELRSISYNGFSEFINEFSGGLVILVLNWLLVSRFGIDGVAAFTVVGYTIFLSLMIFYGVADAVHLLVSQNLGAKQFQRIQQFMGCAALLVACFSAGLVVLLLGFEQYLTGLFLDDDSAAIKAQSVEFIQWVWPLFLVNGMNVMLSVYLTAVQRPLPSMMVACSRSLVLPVVMLLLVVWLLPQVPFVIALPAAEWLTFALALSFYLQVSRRLKFA